MAGDGKVTLPPPSHGTGGLELSGVGYIERTARPIGNPNADLARHINQFARTSPHSAHRQVVAGRGHQIPTVRDGVGRVNGSHNATRSAPRLRFASTASRPTAHPIGIAGRHVPQRSNPTATAGRTFHAPQREWTMAIVNQGGRRVTVPAPVYTSRQEFLIAMNNGEFRAGSVVSYKGADNRNVNVFVRQDNNGHFFDTRAL